MKRVLITILLFLSAIVYGNEISISQKVSYLYDNGYMNTTNKEYYSSGSFGSITNINANINNFTFDCDVNIFKDSKSFSSSLSYNVFLTNNISLKINTQYTNSINTFDYICIVHFGKPVLDLIETNTVIDSSLKVNCGISLNESIKDYVKINMSANVGYVPFYDDFNNLNVTKLSINLNFFKYFDAYFSIESFQEFEDILSYKPRFISNECKLTAHYDFNHISIFVSWEHLCAHTENPWQTNTKVYNKSYTYISFGARFTF